MSLKVTRARYSFCLLHHTKVTYTHDAFTCTLLHRELQDYSLGQIAFGVFSSIIVSACNILYGC